MPTLSCSKKYLFELIGKTFSDEQFEELCFRFGIELDDVTSAAELHLKETKGKKSDAPHSPIDDEVLYKIDCPANRYDLLSVEGMSMALRIFLGIQKTPRYVLSPLKPVLSMMVKKSVFGVRDYVTCAVVRNVTFSKDSFASFIDMQEKLHLSLARKRSLVSVGTHDLDKVTPPFSYEGTAKDQIKFVPLKHTKMLDCTGDGLEQFYKDDKHINKYIPLISSFEKYPVVYDSQRTVLSLPPIINSQMSQISESTRNVFIECTGLDKPKAITMLNLIATSLSLHANPAYHIEPVEIQYEDGTVEITPNLAPQHFQCDVNLLKKQIGLSSDISAAECCDLLSKMQLESTPESATSSLINVVVPATRPDILHQCDIMEDLAISYGYDNLKLTPIPTQSVASQTPIEKLSHLVRLELSAAGYCEMLTLSMCSHDEAYKFLRRIDDGKIAVTIANPQTIEFQVCRPTLLPGTLKTLSSNQNYALPIQLFEVTDVVVLDPSTRTGARNERHLCALYCNTDCSGFEAVRGLLDYIMGKINHPHFKIIQNNNSNDCRSYMDGRGVEIAIEENGILKTIGNLGVVHPEVLIHYQIPMPCSYFELNLTPFCVATSE